MTRSTHISTRSTKGGTVAKMIVFILVICAVGIAVKYLAGRKVGTARDEIAAQVCAEQVIAAYLFSPEDRDQFLAEKGIVPELVGEKVERSGVAHKRMSEDVRDASGPLSFAPYQTFRSEARGDGAYEVNSHVIWRDEASNKEWILSYECVAAPIGDTDVWDVGNISLGGVPLTDSWSVVGSDLRIESVGGEWSVRGGKLIVRIADNSRPPRTVQLGAPEEQ